MTEGQRAISLSYTRDRGLYRVWRDDWASDDFETLEIGEFDQLISFCGMFKISLVDRTDED